MTRAHAPRQVRYNIGGSAAAAGDAHYLRAGGFAPSYLPARGGAYDWTADATQRRVVAAAKKRGVQYVQVIMMLAVLVAFITVMRY